MDWDPTKTFWRFQKSKLNILIQWKIQINTQTIGEFSSTKRVFQTTKSSDIIEIYETIHLAKHKISQHKQEWKKTNKVKETSFTAHSSQSAPTFYHSYRNNFLNNAIERINKYYESRKYLLRNQAIKSTFWQEPFSAPWKNLQNSKKS